MIVALQRFSIGQRVVALALLPLLVLAALGATDVRRLDAAREDAARVVLLTTLADQVGRVVHALQRERGATSLYVSSRGASFGTELTGYRADADGEIATLSAGLAAAGADLPGSVANAARDALAGLDGLAGLRHDADGFAAATDLIPAYTAAIGGLVAAMPVIVSSTSDADAARGLAALAALVVAKERAGIERAQLANAFTTGTFAPGQLVTVAGLVAARQEALATFADLAGPDQAAALTSAAGSAAFTDAARLEEAALAGGTEALEVDPTAWFTAATARIDALMDLERAAGSAVHGAAQRAAAAAARAMVVSSTLVGVALLLTVGLALAIAASIRRPLRRTVGALEALARGELDSELDVPAGARDEIAAMGRATGTATRALREVLLRTVDTAQALAAAATELDQVSAEVSCGVATSTDEAATVGGSAAQVFEAVESVATATEQMGAAVQEISRHANQAASVASRAAGVAHEATASMAALRESSDRIEEVVRAVAQIAEQTNLLALNATIEAARAGAAGKGFAVVAGEVKELAHETSTATDDVTARVAALRSDAAAAADAIARIASIVGEIDDSQAQIAAAVEEQSAVTSTIAEHASSAAGSSDAIARGAQRVADTASRQGQALTGLGGAAHDLARLAADLETGLAAFRL